MILDPFKLDSRVALVTGPGTGLGLAMMIALAEAGTDIAGVYSRHVDAAQEAVERLGRRFLPLRLDLLSAGPRELTDVVQQTVAHLGWLDISGRIPSGRWGTREDLQGAIVLLASSASNYMVGSAVVVDGGYLSR